MTDFIPGLKLSGLFYEEVVAPLLESNFPDLPHSAALIGSGSEVLGFDTPRSMDHHWGPRLILFLSDSDYSQYRETLRAFFSHHLPSTFKGYSTHFGNPDEKGVQLLTPHEAGPINHRVELDTIRGFFGNYLGIDPYAHIPLLDWLTFPQQRLATVSGGQVYHDGLNELNPVRQRLHYFPQEVWLYLLSAQWMRISEEEAFVGRCEEMGDALGGRVVAARLVREIMKLCFLMERTYAPYSKWFGAAFSRLHCAEELQPILMQVLQAENGKSRETHLIAAYEKIAQMHNALNITPKMETQASPYYSRPFLVIHGEHFAQAIRDQLTNETLRNRDYPIGSVDQFTDCVHISSHPSVFNKLKTLH